MATTIILPKLGQTMEEGVIVEWFKKEGDAVNRGDVLFSVESDKAVLEVESKAKGVLRKIIVGQGDKAPVLAPVAIVAGADEDISAELAGASSGAATAAPEQAEPVVEAAAPAAAETQLAAAPQPVAGRERIFASPRARRLAEDKGVDLAYVAGTGPDGRIVEKDVLDFAAKQPAATPLARRMAQDLGVSLASVATPGVRVTSEQVKGATAAAQVAPAATPAQPAAAAPAPQSAGMQSPMAVPVPLPPAEGTLKPLSGIRAIVADRMATSMHTAAPVTLQSVVDATEFVAMRVRLKNALEKELGFGVGYNDILAVIVARCLVEFPYMNVRLEPGGIRQLNDVNVGLAVDSERGLVVPVIRNADKLGIKELAVRFRDLVQRARTGKAGLEDLSGGTFTITNLGMFGVDMFSPVINLPECAILGVGRIRPEVTPVDDKFEVRQKMWLSLTFDHRLVDGAPAARFLQAIMGYVESPYLLLA
ncbi:MAG: 2-oxo acid dehydrogenase subunit E2 [Anaerolineae bacterium]